MKNSTRIQLLVAMILIVGLLSGCSAGVYEAPIDSGVGSGWFQWIVTQIALFTVWISEITGGYYFVGLIIVTLIVRTAGWPIYAKSNAMTVKMQQAQPELEKVKEKYQGKIFCRSAATDVGNGFPTIRCNCRNFLYGIRHPNFPLSGLLRSRL